MEQKNHRLLWGTFLTFTEWNLLSLAAFFTLESNKFFIGSRYYWETLLGGLGLAAIAIIGFVFGIAWWRRTKSKYIQAEWRSGPLTIERVRLLLGIALAFEIALFAFMLAMVILPDKAPEHGFLQLGTTVVGVPGGSIIILLVGVIWSYRRQQLQR